MISTFVERLRLCRAWPEGWLQPAAQIWRIFAYSSCFQLLFASLSFAEVISRKQIECMQNGQNWYRTGLQVSCPNSAVSTVASVASDQACFASLHLCAISRFATIFEAQQNPIMLSGGVRRV
jgi:hypothetical protein